MRYQNLVQRLMSCLLLVAMFWLVAANGTARAYSETEALVGKSELTLDALLNYEHLPQLQAYLEKSRAVLIFPELIKGGLIVGAEGGSGLLLVRGGDGTWSPPAFYTIASGSVGLQIGGKVSEVILTIMNDGAVDALLNKKFTLGADASAAVGPYGKAVGTSATANLKQDIYAFAKAEGAFGGVALDGAWLFARKAWNEEYYGTGATPRAIVLERRFNNMNADKLRSLLP